MPFALFKFEPLILPLYSATAFSCIHWNPDIDWLTTFHHLTQSSAGEVTSSPKSLSNTPRYLERIGPGSMRVFWSQQLPTSLIKPQTLWELLRSGDGTHRPARSILSSSQARRTSFSIGLYASGNMLSGCNIGPLERLSKDDNAGAMVIPVSDEWRQSKIGAVALRCKVRAERAKRRQRQRQHGT